MAAAIVEVPSCFEPVTARQFVDVDPEGLPQHISPSLVHFRIYLFFVFVT